jgi:hypothetical protein
MNPNDVAALVAAQPTISGKIRAMSAAGFSRAEIARQLNRSYQQVRQVLVQDDARRARATEPSVGMSEGAPAAFDHQYNSAGVEPGAIYRLEVQADGAVQLPLAVERALGFARGGVIIAEFEGDRLVLLSTAKAVQRAQDLVRELIPGSDSLAQSLIEDRRREARAEAEGG